MMRDPDRIDKILYMLSHLWHKYPDLRLGQLLYGFANFIGDIFNYEDDETYTVLKEVFRREFPDDAEL
jgi:uncharacterized protein YihD (DUF1040 family)